MTENGRLPSPTKPGIEDVPPQDTEEKELTYEEQRLATIRANEQLLKDLGLAPASIPPTQPPSTTPTRAAPKVKRSKEPIIPQPVRKSARISAVLKRDEEGGRKRKRPRMERNASSLTSLSREGSGSGYETDTSSERQRGNRKAILPPGERLRIPKMTSVKYTEGDADYSERRPLPRREGGRLIFEGPFQGVFIPNLTPEEVLRGGAFGGNYYADTYSSVLGRPLQAKEDIANLPAQWLREDLPSSSTPPVVNPFTITTHLTAPTRDPLVNRYGVPAGQGLKEWEKSGWIWQGDPRGWMQWYVAFYLGRRCEDDERQVQRWLNLAGPTGRFSRMLMKKIASHPGSGGAVVGNTAVEDEDVGRVLRQVCWQWGLVMDREEWRRRIEGGL